MSATRPQDTADIAPPSVPAADVAPAAEKEMLAGTSSIDDVDEKYPRPPNYDSSSASASEEDYDDKPTKEELKTLRRVPAAMNWSIFTIAFAELCERFSYYGSSVLYTNFVMRPLPPGSNTGASHGTSARIPGALGMGQKAAQGISLTNMFFAYITPLFGAYVADAKLGRYVTIHIAIAISTVAHVILVAASSPGVIVKRDSSLAAFIIGMLGLCLGTGFFKANISPLLAEQNTDTRLRVEVRKGERVIVDPAVTNTRIFLYFYFAINIGSVAGQISMVYVEKYVGFWLAFLLPTILFLLAPLVLWSNKKKYRLSPPTGSVLSKCLQMFGYTMKKSGYFKKVDWNYARPSKVPVEQRPSWMTYDDAWVDQVRRGLLACKVFIFLPIFHLAYNQLQGNLVAQSSTMQLNGVPNDLIQNLNPITILIMVPILDRGLYPALRKLGIRFTPVKKMTVGFLVSSLAMVSAAVMQHFIYQKSPCGEYASSDDCDPAPISVWAQLSPYVLIGISELFTNVTSYEYAFSKAPENMRSLVMSINLFTSAFAAAVGQAFTPLSGDPLLVWNYTTIALIAFIGGIAFYLCFYHYDDREDHLTMLNKSEYIGNHEPGKNDSEAPVVVEK